MQKSKLHIYRIPQDDPEDVLMRPEGERAADEANQLTPEKLREMQTIANESETLLPTQLNRVLDREYKDEPGGDEEVLMPTGTIKEKQS